MNKGQTIRRLGGSSFIMLDQRATWGKVNGCKGLDLSQQACNDAWEQTFPFLFSLVHGYLRFSVLTTPFRMFAWETSCKGQGCAWQESPLYYLQEDKKCR